MSPWAWRPSLNGWFFILHEQLEVWSPEELNFEDLNILRAAIYGAALSQADWLYHPFMSPIFGDRNATPFIAAQVVAWAALNDPSTLGIALNYDDSGSIYRLDGKRVSLPGPVTAGELASIVADGCQLDVAINPRPTHPVILEVDGSRDEVSRLRHHEARIYSELPMVAHWISSTAEIMIPQAAQPGTFVSSSSPNAPGVIRVSPTDDALQLLEAMTHETAHLYLFRTEQQAALVQNDCKHLFPSPLRADPRPMRGLLLAMHACAYIAAAFAEAAKTGLDIPARCAAQRDESLDLFDEAQRTVDSGKGCLTPEGLKFVELTAAVAYAARQAKNSQA